MKIIAADIAPFDPDFRLGAAAGEGGSTRSGFRCRAWGWVFCQRRVGHRRREDIGLETDDHRDADGAHGRDRIQIGCQGLKLVSRIIGGQVQQDFLGGDQAVIG